MSVKFSDIHLDICLFLHCLIAKPEDVQYFQFNSDGNMYVYKAGAECTGAVRKVAPGEELNFSSNVPDISTQRYNMIAPSNVTAVSVGEVHHQTSVLCDGKKSTKSKSRYYEHVN